MVNCMCSKVAADISKYRVASGISAEVTQKGEQHRVSIS